MAQKHYFIAMDTEFPGVVARPVGNKPQNSLKQPESPNLYKYVSILLVHNNYSDLT